MSEIQDTGAAAPAAQSGEIDFDDFLKVMMKVGTVTAAERVPKSDKLLKLTVSIGDPSPRTVLAGIGREHGPDSLVGKQFLFVINLKPRKMMGIESHGMLLASYGDGNMALMAPSSRLPDGSRAG